MKKVLHINSYFNGSFFYDNLYKKQREKGLNVSVFVPLSVDKRKEKKDYGDYVTWSKNHNNIDRYIFSLKHQKIYMDLLGNYNMNDFNIVHAHSLFANGSIALKVKKKFDIPYIVAVRNTDVNVFFKKMFHLRKLGIEILKHAQKIVFISEGYRELVINTYVPKPLKVEFKKKSIVIPNGIDDFWFENQVRMPKKITQSGINLLYIGDINENKNVVTTVKAIQKLINKGWNIDFTVIGTVKDEKIHNEILGYEFLKYKGPVPKEELITYYRKSDIFIMPSIHETFGLVYAEAMSQGLPVIYSRSQGFDKQFDEGEVGYSVNPLDENEIVSVIEKLVGHFDEISSNCLKNVRKFNWDGIADIYASLYEFDQ